MRLDSWLVIVFMAVQVVIVIVAVVLIVLWLMRLARKRNNEGPDNRPPS